MAKSTPKDREFKIKLYTQFQFTYYENAVNVAMALGQAGHFVDIEKESVGYIVNIYKQV